MSNQIYTAVPLIVAMIFLFLGCLALLVRRRLPDKLNKARYYFMALALYSLGMSILNVWLAYFALWG